MNRADWEPRGLSPSRLGGCCVTTEQGEPIDAVLRRLKKVTEAAGIANDIRRHAHFETPGNRRRIKSAVARRRATKPASATPRTARAS